MPNPMYQLGEEMNSETCGRCKITDIYKSIHGKIAYEVTITPSDDNDLGGVFVYREEDL